MLFLYVSGGVWEEDRKPVSSVVQNLNYSFGKLPPPTQILVLEGFLPP